MNKQVAISPLFAAIVFSGLLGITSFAQKHSARGDRYFDHNLFETAIEFYKRDVKARKKDVREHAMQRLADCYRITGDYAQAEAVYQKVLRRDKKDPINYLNYGLALMNSARYEDAAEQFKSYLEKVPGNAVGEMYLRSCDSAQKWLDISLGREVKNIIEINSEESEFSPTVVNGELVISSSRPGTTRKLITLNGGNEIKRLDLYTVPVYSLSARKKSKSPLKKVPGLNTALHEGPATFSQDGNEVYFTRPVKGRRNTETNEAVSTLQVFYAAKDSNGKWSKPVSAFTFNSMEYSLGHPSLSRNGKRIYFMSDKPGGMGNTDIYFSDKRADGSWSDPVNAGKNVNTFAHELFPYAGTDNKLYFSSNGHAGMGQLDVFSSEVQGGKFQQARNLKPPVNSQANDFGFTHFRSAGRGFFSSDRFNGKGAEDIYAFSEELPIELSFIEDTLILQDYSLFDDIRFQLNNINDTTFVPLTNNRGALEAVLNENNTYELIAEQYGMQISRIEFTYQRDPKHKSASYAIMSSNKRLHFTGKIEVGIWDKGADTGFDPKKTYSTLSNTYFGELRMAIDKRGVFTFDVELEPGKEHVVNSRDIERFKD